MTNHSSTQNRFKLSPDTVANRVGQQIVLVHIKTDRIFSLNRTASRLWELLSTGVAIGEIQKVMLKEFKVEAEQLSQEIDHLLLTLRQEQLIVPSDEK